MNSAAAMLKLNRRGTTARWNVVNQLMPTLSSYPLYPYLQYRQITDDLMNQPPLVVTNFIAANPTLPAARSLNIALC